MDVDDLLDSELQEELEGFSVPPLVMAEGQETNEDKLMREALLDGASRVSISTMLRRRSLVDVETDMLPPSPTVVKTLDFDDTASFDSESQYSEISCHTEDSFMASSPPPPSRLTKPNRVSSSSSSSSSRSKPVSSLPRAPSYAFGSSSSTTVPRTRPSSIPVPRESSLRARGTSTATSATSSSSSRTLSTPSSMVPTRASSVKSSKLPLKPAPSSAPISRSSADPKAPPRSSRSSTPAASPTYASGGKSGFGGSAASSDTGRPSRSNSVSSTKSAKAATTTTSSAIVSPPTLLRGKSMSQVSVAALFKVHFTTEAEIDDVLAMPPLRAIDSKGRIDQMDKYIRKLKYRLRELKMQRDAFSLACQGIERDLTDEHAATARAYATAKQELLHVSSRGSDDVARCGDRRGSAGEPSGPVDPSPSCLLLHPSSSKEVPDNEEEDQSVLNTLDSNMQEFVRNAMERSTSQMVAKYQALLAEKEHAQEAQLQTLREYYTHSMSSSTADAW
ncbi:hypothetical protein AaE_013765, partial [Aphanomyces astaci]